MYISTFGLGATLRDSGGKLARECVRVPKAKKELGRVVWATKCIFRRDSAVPNPPQAA